MVDQVGERAYDPFVANEVKVVYDQDPRPVPEGVTLEKFEPLIAFPC